MPTFLRSSIATAIAISPKPDQEWFSKSSVMSNYSNSREIVLSAGMYLSSSTDASTHSQNSNRSETGISISGRGYAFGLGAGLALTVVYVTVEPQAILKLH
jgi:hypothetical protein